MGEKAEKVIVLGMKFGWNFLNSEQKEMLKAIMRIIKSLSDEKILEIGTRTGPKEK